MTDGRFGKAHDAARRLLAQPAARLAAALLALIMLAAPHLVPAAPFTALDMLAPAPASFNPSESPAQSFPGSAFFFAEGAFAPAPDIPEPAGAHIFALARVEAMAAVPFVGLTALDRLRAQNCLATAIYYEAANEPDAGQRAVAQVVLNRARHPFWPATICGVVYQGTERTDLRCQFTFSCDGSMARRADPAKWSRARAVAIRALAGDVFAPVGTATYYHTLAVHPDWSGTLDPVAVAGAHIFYEMRGADRSPRAFHVAYAGRESAIGPSINAYMRPRPAPDMSVPLAMPLDIPAPVATGYAPPPVAATSNPYMPRTFEEGLATPLRASPPQSARDALPASGIRAEYRNSGKPLI